MFQIKGLNISHKRDLRNLLEDFSLVLNPGDKAVIIGEGIFDAIFRKGASFYVKLAFVILGGILYYIIMIIILWLKLDPNDLKLFTAILVAAALALPLLQGKVKERRRRAVD